VKLAVKTNAWRNRAIISLDGAVKPSLRCISKSIKEAVSVSVTDDDCILQDLKLQETYATRWIISAKQVIGDGGRASLQEVCALIEEGERLSVSVSKELSALRTRRELYCICRKPYDDDQSMIACDNCGEWYHYSCLGLPEPDLERSDERCVVQQDAADFVCPDCEQAQHIPVGDRVRDMLPSFQAKDTQANHCAPDALQAPVTPEAPKETEVPQAGLRGKRSSRAKTKAIVQPKWQQSHVLTNNDNTSSSSEAETPTSGRPCRRTAGRHSGFDNYVLLMRSR
jgi:histone demethylase JARID1